MKAKYFICVPLLPHKSDTANVSFFLNPNEKLIMTQALCI